MASSVSGPPAKRSPSSPTSGSTRCSTAGRSRPASRPATARSILVYKDMGLVSQVFDERALSSLRGHLAVGHCRYSTTGGSHLGERPAHPRRDGRRHGRPGPQRQPHQLRRAARPRRGPQRRRRSGHLGGELRRGNTTDTALVTALLAGDPDRSLEAAALDVLPELRGRLLLRLHGRAHPVRRPRPAGHPPAGPRPPRAGLGRGQRDRRPGHRRRQLHPRGRAR